VSDLRCQAEVGSLMGQSDSPNYAERIARSFHEVYERLAPDFGYETRRESAKPWKDVPEPNRKLMTAVVQDLLDAGVIRFNRTDEPSTRHRGNLQKGGAMGLTEYDAWGPKGHPARDTTELSFERLSAINGRRCERWHGPDWCDPGDAWTIADWSNAMAGEAGEAANVVKKLRRVDTDLWDKQRYPGETRADLAQKPPAEARDVLMAKLADELADVVLYADLLAQKAGIDLGDAVRSKFNRVSVAQDFPERL
jgi:NTP pyrophosphatase (non-canonical NTP hydrolase)